MRSKCKICKKPQKKNITFDLLASLHQRGEGERYRTDWMGPNKATPARPNRHRASQWLSGVVQGDLSILGRSILWIPGTGRAVGLRAADSGRSSWAVCTLPPLRSLQEHLGPPGQTETPPDAPKVRRAGGGEERRRGKSRQRGSEQCA